MPSVGDLQINIFANAAEFQNVMGQVKSTLVQVGATTQTTLGGQTATAAAQGASVLSARQGSEELGAIERDAPDHSAIAMRRSDTEALR